MKVWQREKIKPLTFKLGVETVSFCYNPLNPPSFGAEGTFLKSIEESTEVISLYLPELDADVFIKGRMKATLAVCSDCSDTTFYMAISIQKPQGDYVLRHDITSLCYQLGDYTPNSEVLLDFCFDEYAFLLKKGERLRIDIASTDNNSYVCHTNQKGEYYLQTEVKQAINKVNLSRSVICLPVEE